MQIQDLDTPALLIDLDAMERNLGRMAEYTRTRNLRLRPHTKTHKIPALGERQLALGAVGLTVAKVSEAEVMLRSRTPDLLIAFPVIGPAKLRRLAEVARQARVTVSLDSVAAAEQLSTLGVEIGVLVEIDVGLGRVGVTPGPELVNLADKVARLPHLRLEGLAFYPGHIKLMDEEGQKQLQALGQVLRESIGLLTQHGHEVRIVSGGSTPTMYHSHEIAGLNEIRPGTYVFNDRNTVLSGACTPADCAVSILTTVVSTARPDQIILDGGSKTFSSDRFAGPDGVTFGLLPDAPGARFHKMNEEHGFVDVREAERRFTIGDRVKVVPNHVCVAMNLHEQVYGVRGETVEEVWRVEGRGKLQ